MQYDEIPELPKILESEKYKYDEEFIINEFKKGKNKFIFYDTEYNEPRFFFKELDEQLYAALVYILSQNSNKKIYEFLKLVIEGVRFIKINNKKSYLSAVRIEKYIEDNK